MDATAIVRSCSSLHLQLTFEADTLRPFRSVGCSQPLGLCRNIPSGNPQNGFVIREKWPPRYFLHDLLCAGTKCRWFRYAFEMNSRRPKFWRQKLADISAHDLKRFYEYGTNLRIRNASRTRNASKNTERTEEYGTPLLHYI